MPSPEEFADAITALEEQGIWRPRAGSSPALNRINARRLLVDLYGIMNGRHIFSADAVATLRDLPRAPWANFRGDGLTVIDMGRMLKFFDVTPRAIRIGPKKSVSRVARGYRIEDVERAVNRLLSALEDARRQS